ncbi:MAG TPA: tannase/feruloyl esterase family alpha/beta hydrolase [Vicinamibacterales bacterium]|nr:tannase/feruloyl esterase family alpha/beta hydrolase [Vicinamibacterales bacterium]
MTRRSVCCLAASSLFALLIGSLHAQTTGPSAGSCAALAKVTLPNVTITSATLVAAGALPPPPARGGGPGGAAANPFADLPAVCRVTATLKPSADSDIKMELWLPTPPRAESAPGQTGWNGKFRGTGNGGLGGGAGVNVNALANGVRRGYATAGHNTGHEGDSSYALEHPEKIKDFGYRATHEMTVTSKALVRAFYGKAPTLSYMAEGGGGTIAALSSAQRYPDDYDAIAVTGMSSYLTRHTFAQMWIWEATHKDAASFIPPDKYPVLHDAVLAACDTLDGLKDGVVGDPLGCRFDLTTVQCKEGVTAGCLTPPQIEAARKIYQGPKHARTGAELYSPLYPGSELGWGQLAGGEQPLGIPVEFFRFYVLRDPKWDYRTRPLDYDGDVTASDRPEIQAVNAVDPDLRRFFARGGKLLLVDGWNDTAVPPKVAINYFNRVVATVGERQTRESLRFFMVPGMGHGPGTGGAENFDFDALSLIEQWKEKGVVPDQLIVGHYKDGKRVGARLVCQFPRVAFFKGGDGEDPASFECRTK